MRTWVAIAAFAVCGLCFASDPPAPTKPKNGEIKQQKTPGSEHAKAPQVESSEEHPVVIKVLPPPNGSEEAKDAKKDREQKAAIDRELVKLTGDLADYTKVLAIFTGALFVVAPQDNRKQRPPCVRPCVLP